MILLNNELKQKFEVRQNALVFGAQTDPRDLLFYEIGDEKDSNLIQPQLKLLRHDNEYNLSIRKIYNGKETPKIQSDGNKIIWQAGDEICRFYELGKTNELPQGGFEFDSIVNLKKSGNSFFYTIKSKGIFFWKQEALTNEQKAEGAFRPDYITGGYALYANNNPQNWDNGKLYRCGKIGEIPAPVIRDSAGRFAKCGLVISPERELMRIDVPDEFAQKAQNPCYLDPTIGNTHAGSSSATCNNTEGRGLPFTMGSSGATIQSITLSCAIYGGAPKFKGAIVEAGSVVIVANGVGPAVTVGATQAWKTSTFGTDPEIFAGGSYIVCNIQGSSSSDTISHYYDSGVSGSGRWMDFDDYASPTSVSIKQVNSNYYSIYATYTAKAASSFLPMF